MAVPTARKQSSETVSGRRRVLGALALVAAVAAAVPLGGLAGRVSVQGSLFLIAGHAVLFLVGLIGTWSAIGNAGRPFLVGGGVTCTIAALLALLPGLAPLPRNGVLYLHVVAGLAVAALALSSLLRGDANSRKRKWFSTLPILLAVGLLPAYGYREWAWATWSPPRYSSEACYRFLTATTPEQSGEPLFPSALRASGAGPRDCRSSGCHASVHQAEARHPHASAGSSPAYARLLGDFVRRRGSEAGKWCAGCHTPDAMAVDMAIPTAGGGIGCNSCHRADTVHALYGSAALQLRAGGEAERHPWQVLLRRKQHAAENDRPSFLRSAEFCGACHRKNWNLPQNGFHWMPGPDEFGQWQASRYSPASLFASGERAQPRSCLGCHTAHGETPAAARSTRPALELSLFMRRGLAGRLVDLLTSPLPTRSGEPLWLDVVVRNAGIGHDFPTGMPDLQESWLEVSLLDSAGQERLSAGRVTPGGRLPRAAHVYRLVAVDRKQRSIAHGNLDEMVAVAEWRRIPAGAADLARFAFNAPPGGVGRVRVRLLRRRRPEFSAWVREPVQRAPEVLASIESGMTDSASVPAGEGARWRNYGLALGSVKAYPEALQALTRALQTERGDAETLLALGRVYLDDGDLLAAREQFRQASAADPLRGHAWEGAVLRRMGQPDQAAALLEPLARRYPRDLRLRFELGSAYLAALRNAEAAREFEAMLDVDPIDVSAHYNLMLCLQRLNRLTDARREETIYRLLRRESARVPEARSSLEDRPLHVHRLEPAP